MVVKEMSLKVENLRFQYSHQSPTLFQGLSHTFSNGMITAITGPSGCGKSTLLYLLGLMLKPTAGEIKLDGESISTLKATQRAKLRAEKMGFVFQDALLNPYRTILDSVIEPALYAGKRRKTVVYRAVELLSLIQVEYRHSHKPNEISGGQAQRVAIARALINDPRIILADEPTGNLDARNTQVMLQLLKEQAEEGRIVIIVTHDPRVVDGADQVLELQEYA